MTPSEIVSTYFLPLLAVFGIFYVFVLWVLWMIVKCLKGIDHSLKEIAGEHTAKS